MPPQRQQQHQEQQQVDVPALFDKLHQLIGQGSHGKIVKAADQSKELAPCCFSGPPRNHQRRNRRNCFAPQPPLHLAAFLHSDTQS